MVYLEPSQLGWEPLVQSWMHARFESLDVTRSSSLPSLSIVSLSATLPTSLRTMLQTMCNEIIPLTLAFLRKHCSDTVEISPSMRVNSFLRLLYAVLSKGFGDEVNVKLIENWVKGIFLFCLVWSFGATLEADTRPKFDTFVRRLHLGSHADPNVSIKCEVPIPEDGCVYDFLFEVSSL